MSVRTNTWIRGLRVVDLAEFSEQLYCTHCGAHLELKQTRKETRFGLASILSIACSCGALNDVYTCKKMKTQKGTFLYAVNALLTAAIMDCKLNLEEVSKLFEGLRIPLLDSGSSASNLLDHIGDTVIPALSTCAESLLHPFSPEEPSTHRSGRQFGAECVKHGTPDQSGTPAESSQESKQSIKESAAKLENTFCSPQADKDMDLTVTVSFTSEEEQGDMGKSDAQVTTDSADHSEVTPAKKCFFCDICGLNLSSRYNLLRHQRTFHKLGKQYICTIAGCNRVFYWEEHLDNHKKAVHGQDKPFQCSRCGKLFGVKKYWAAHSFRCGRKPYKCPHCEQNFGDCAGRSNHIQRFHKGMTFICFCGKSYQYRSSLNKHVKMCHGVKSEFPDSSHTENSDQHCSQQTVSTEDSSHHDQYS